MNGFLKKGLTFDLKKGTNFCKKNVLNVFQFFEKTVDMVLLDTNFDNIFL